MRYLAMLCALVWISPAFAQDEAPDTGLVMLPCDGKCAAVTRNPIRKTGKLNPAGGALAGDTEHEEVVELQYTIMPDGHVADDVSVIRQFGSPEHIENIKRDIRRFTYEPAIVDGQPVAISHRILVVNSNVSQRTLRPSVANLYEQAGTLIKAGKFDDVRAKLKEAIGLTSLNFNERGVLAYLLSVTDMQRKDYVEARIEAELALMFPNEVLPKPIIQSVARTYITASVYLGDIVAAAKALDGYQKMKVLAQDDPLGKELSQVRAKLDALPSYGIDVSIPNRDVSDVFEIYLYRRHFGFSNVKGKLDGVTISCTEQETTSPYADKVAWSVPNNWSNCFLLIKGEPGTTFQLDQYVAAPSGR